MAGILPQFWDARRLVTFALVLTVDDRPWLWSCKTVYRSMFAYSGISVGAGEVTGRDRRVPSIFNEERTHRTFVHAFVSLVRPGDVYYESKDPRVHRRGVSPPDGSRGPLGLRTLVPEALILLRKPARIVRDRLEPQI